LCTLGGKRDGEGGDVVFSINITINFRSRSSSSSDTV
jgi:hypothetical protein